MSEDDLAAAVSIARTSLDEVKAQTEYQDAKSGRLLTITTFLSALSGVLLGRLLDSYPLREVASGPGVGRVLVPCCYAVFALSALSSLCGAVISFHATRTRFRYPRPAPAASTGAFPKSLIFWRGIVASTPEDWASTFVEAGSRPTRIRSGLRERELAGIVQEAYLVAAKAADKLRMLEPAQRALSFSLKCLLVWLALLGVTALAVPPIAKPPVLAGLSPGAADCVALAGPRPGAGDRAIAAHLRCVPAPR